MLTQLTGHQVVHRHEAANKTVGGSEPVAMQLPFYMAADGTAIITATL